MLRNVRSGQITGLIFSKLAHLASNTRELLEIADVLTTFYSPDELPDRDVSKIKHPLVTDSMDLLAPLVKAGKVKVWFTHLNHSNPALDPNGEARKAIEGRGFRVLAEGEELGL